MANFTQEDIDSWFKSATRTGFTVTEPTPDFQRLNDLGFNFDVRDKHGLSALWHAAHTRNYGPMIEETVKSLRKQYANEPEKLVESLEAGSGILTPKQTLLNAGATPWANIIGNAVNDAKGQIKASAFEKTQNAEDLKPIPRSSNPPPLKADQTLTLTRLQETKPDGRTNLQIFAEQGQLADIFTAAIWQGRREEMDKAWELVPTQHQSQINIELVRAQIGVTEGRARFSMGSEDRSQGF